MKLAILDYSTASVDIIDNVPDMTSNEEIEKYLDEKLLYCFDQISWMNISRGYVNYLNDKLQNPRPLAASTEC